MPLNDQTQSLWGSPSIPAEPQLPSYLQAADLHNIGNNKKSFLETTGDALMNAPSFTEAAFLSGYNSFYNSGLTIGRVLGITDEENRKTSAFISSIDSDLGIYYKQNEGAVDVAGFLLGSLLPGIGGIKILNMGQKALAATESGFVGTNIGAAMGLRTPMVETYIATAAKEIASGQALYANLGTSGVKALSAGIYQNVLEGIAFETAIQATMFASPILQEQTKSDILWNVATGGLFQGVLGGAFHAATTFGAIKKGVDIRVNAIREFGSRDILVETGNTSMDIAWIAKAVEMKKNYVAGLDPASELYRDQIAAFNAMSIRAANDMRASTHKLVTGEQRTLANMVADLNVGNDANSILGRMTDTVEIHSLAGTTSVDKAILKAIKDETGIDPALQTHFWQLTGEGAGRVLDRTPGVYNIADTVMETGKAGLRERVMEYVRKQKFKIEDLWDASSVSLSSAMGHMEAEARYIWAKDSNLLKEIKAGQQVHQFDIPVLLAAAERGVLDLTVVRTNGALIKNGFASKNEMLAFIQAQQEKAAISLGQKALKSTKLNISEDSHEWINQKISKITNINVSRLETESRSLLDFDMYGNAQKAYETQQAAKGLNAVKGEETNIRFMPSWAKVAKKVVSRDQPDGTVVDAMTHFAAQQEATQQAVNNVAAKVFGDLYVQFPEIEVAELASATVRGTGAGMFSYNNPAHGTLGSKAALIGSVVERSLVSAKKVLADRAEGALAALGAKQEAVIEWGGLHQKMSRSAQRWTALELEDGSRALVSEAAVKQLTKASESELGAETSLFGEVAISVDALEEFSRTTGVQHHIPVTQDETWNLIQAHVTQDIKHTLTNQELAAVRGKTARTPYIDDKNKTFPIFRPIPVDPKDAKFYVFVSDPKVTGQGHVSMIFAQSPEKLESLVKAAKNARPDLEIRTSSNTKDFFAARGSYEYDRTLTENYLDGALKNEGVYSEYFIKTDPQQVVNDFLAYHTRKIDSQLREVARQKYQPQFDWLEDQAKYYGEFDTSKIGGSIHQLEATAKNPYLSYIKTALNLSRANENPLWYSINKAVDAGASKVVGNIQDIWNGIKGGGKWGPEEQAAEKATNALLQKHGLNTGYVTAAEQLLVNQKVPQGEMSRFISGANSLLARVVLSLDPLNALVNATSANILRMTELKSQLRAIKAGNEAVAGKLTKLLEIDVTGAGDTIWSAAKLNAGGIQAYIKTIFAETPAAKAELQFYKDIGVIREISDQFKAAIDNLTLRGTEVVQDLNPRLAKAKELIDGISKKGELFTGNKHAEEMNRFASAWGMKQLTQPLVDAGEMSAAEQIAYINTHVNRVEGNIIASQRPFVFQGPIGQAIGLFQSYQFNLMQQMFRYVAEGTKKDAAMLLGLQGTFFGIQGLPGFQAINQHVIGTMSGNTQHQDVYSITHGIAGKNIGDLLLYGLPSNLLQTNLYSRGDINPRQLTILPTALNEVPLVNATMKVFGGIKDSLSRVAGGANVWESILQGIEHTSVNRPLAGIAQVLQATTGSGKPFSTTSQGGILFSNDLASLATFSRIAGGRPLDEAIVNDELFRIHSYNAYDHLKMQALATRIKTSNIEGQTMSTDQIASFADQYARNGGRQINFNRFMVNEIKAAQVSEAEKLAQNLKSPYSQRMQTLMGGGSATSGSILSGPSY
jgi:hypothetical protein